MAYTAVDQASAPLSTDPAQKPKTAASQTLGTQPVTPGAPAGPTAAPLSLAGAASASGGQAAPVSPAQTAVANATTSTADPLAFSSMAANTATSGPTASIGAQPVNPTPPAPTGGVSTQPAGTPTPAPVSTPAPSAPPPRPPIGGTSDWSVNGETGQISFDNGYSMPVKDYIQQKVADGTYRNLEDAELGILGTTTTGITSTMNGVTKYADGKQPFDIDAWLAANHKDAAQPGTPATSPSGVDPIIGQMTPPTSAPTSTTGHGAGVGTTPTDPMNALTSQTITPNNTVDRVKLAQDAYNSAVTNELDPQFQANLRDTSRLSFGQGRGVSGQNRTSLGNVASDYQRTKANLENQLITGATNGSIDDMYRNLGIAQQQQGFQAGQQQTAFNQNYATQQLSDSERQQLFNEAIQQFYAGNISDPAQFYQYIAGQYARPVGGGG